MKNKYVIRYTNVLGGRVRKYFPNKIEAESFANRWGLPKSQIKRL